MTNLELIRQIAIKGAENVINNAIEGQDDDAIFVSEFAESKDSAVTKYEAFAVLLRSGLDAIGCR